MVAEVARIVGVAVLAVVTAVAGSFVHSWARPWGLILAVAAAAAVMIVARRATASRIGVGVVGLAWLAPVLVFSLGRAEGDIVISSDVVGQVFLFGGVLCVGIAFVLGTGDGRVRGFE